MQQRKRKINEEHDRAHKRDVAAVSRFEQNTRIHSERLVIAAKNRRVFFLLFLCVRSVCVSIQFGRNQNRSVWKLYNSCGLRLCVAVCDIAHFNTNCPRMISTMQLHMDGAQCAMSAARPRLCHRVFLSSGDYGDGTQRSL